MSRLSSSFSPPDCKKICNLIMYAELTGKKSHGIIRLLPGKFGTVTETNTNAVSIVNKTRVSSITEGGGNPGMLVGHYAMEEVIRIVKEHDIAVVGTRNSFGTSGALGYYGEEIANHGYIGLVMAHCMPLLAPFKSKTPLFGTNPICLSMPQKQNALVLDISPAAITYGSISNHEEQGTSIPPNSAIDDEGNMTVDPAKAVRGALLPFADSYKSSGIAMIVELLAAVWTDADYCGRDNCTNWGNIFFAFSPQLLADTKSFERNMTQFLSVLSKTPARDGDYIRIPGRESNKKRQNALKANSVEVDERIVNKIKAVIE